MPPTIDNAKSVKAVQAALQQLNHATAQEVSDWVQRTHPQGKKVSLTSIYRALNHLITKSQVKPLHFNDGQVRYELNSHQMHHHHFICTACNSVQMVDICPYEGLAEALQSQFFIQYHNFELFGLCMACKAQAV